MKVYKIYTELLDYEPLIWRRLLVTDAMKLSNLAYALMVLYETMGEHLFNFYSPKYDAYYALPDEEALDEEIDARKTALRKVMDTVGQEIIFNYDFGDNWEISVKLEEITEPEFHHQKYPIVIDGEGYGIIEDCGGVCGLEDIAEAFKKKKGREYKEYREWLGLGDGDDDIDLKTFNYKKERFKREMSHLRAIYEHKEEWVWTVE